MSLGLTQGRLQVDLNYMQARPDQTRHLRIMGRKREDGRGKGRKVKRREGAGGWWKGSIEKPRKQL